VITTQTGVPVELWDVTKSFDANVVLRKVALRVEPGEFVAIVGKSGCGKSTLLRLVAGLERPTRGAVLVDRNEVREAGGITRYMFQDARLLPWKRVLDNVALGLPRRERAQAQRALEQVGLSDRADDWPAILSGGQRQRVALARALVSRPSLLLLDEPLGALDALTRLEMQQLIETLWRERGFTALLVTHDVEEAVALADRVVVIAEGSVVGDYLIDLPRPRRRLGAQFDSLKAEILDQVMERTRQLTPQLTPPDRAPRDGNEWQSEKEQELAASAPNSRR
jgi:sulfonate transport system ATP-binding protein